MGLAAGAALALAGCERAPSASPQDIVAQQLPGGASEDASSADRLTEDCLALVWASQSNPPRDHDRKLDAARGGSIACDMQTSASEVEGLLAALKAASVREDYRALADATDTPVLFIDAGGTRAELAERAAIEAASTRMFDPQMRALLARLTLADMEIVRGQGGMFALGSVWIVAPRNGARPLIITINREALDEALAAGNVRKN